jgi:hypothetical protein
MSSEDLEIADYFRVLLEHERQCESAACPTCAVLHRIVTGFREQLFRSTPYTIAGSPPAEVRRPKSNTKGSTRRRQTQSVR